MIKNIVICHLKQVFNTLALPAVLYAENLIGMGLGEEKKEIAANFILEKLPLYLKPFRPLIKNLLSDLIDFVIELAVSKLHNIQRSVPGII